MTGHPTAPAWATPRLYAGLAAVSGFCALGYEVLYLRHLTNLLGDMLYVHAALLSSFLVGVGVGAVVAHRLHRWLFAVEAGTGLYALSLPIITGWMGHQAWMAEVAGSPTLTVAATGVLVVVPGLLVGFSMPLFSAYAKDARREALAFHDIYTLYNLGAFLGIAAVELVLVRVLGISQSLRVLALLNFAVAAVLVAAGTRRVARPSVQARSFRPRILGAVFVASLASAVFQMFFLKLTYLVFTPHRENFALAVAVSLLGIAVGSWWASRTSLRFRSAMVLVPLALGAVFLAHPLLADMFVAMYAQTGVSEWGGRLTRIGFALVYGFVPMMAFGAILPTLMRSEASVAKESGLLLFVSSMANAAGYVLFVFAVHPAFSGSGTLVLIGACALVAAALVSRESFTGMEKAVALAGVVLAALLLGSWDDADFYLAGRRAALVDGVEVTTFKSGGESASLVRGPLSSWVSYNGFPSITVEREGVVNHAELLSGLIPALTAPSLERALVLGMGTGITAGAAAQVFQRVDVVEINRAFLHMAPMLRHATFGLDVNPRASIEITDGRSYLVGKEGVYDAIVNSIPAPTYYSASKIYTVEFYQRVQAALKPDGIFATWLSTGNMTPAGMSTVLRTLAEVFQHCDLRPLRSNYYMATCGRQTPVSRSAESLGLPAEVLRVLEQSLGGFDPVAYLDDLRVSTDLLGALPVSGAALNRDDRPVLEFQVLDRLRVGPEPADQFRSDPERYNIDPVNGLTDPMRIVRKAATLASIDRQWLERWFLPLFANDSALAQAWEGYETGAGGGS